MRKLVDLSLESSLEYMFWSTQLLTNLVTWGQEKSERDKQIRVSKRCNLLPSFCQKALVKWNDKEVCQKSKTLIRDAAFFALFVYLPFNHLESCLTVRRVGLSPRLRYMTASIARKSVTVAEYSFPSGEEGKKKQGGRSIRNSTIASSLISQMRRENKTITVFSLGTLKEGKNPAR